MILHWDQLAWFYGDSIQVYQPRFAIAGQTTHGILCCRWSPSGERVAASAGDHAEDRLLQSEVWQQHLPAALSAWSPFNDPIIVTLAINRSPCTDCTELLIDALTDLHRRFPLRCDQSRFILASRGAYEDSGMITRTSHQGLERLHEAGWELAVLQVGPNLSQRGQLLLQSVQRICGEGLVRFT